MSQMAISPIEQADAAVLDVVDSFTGRIWRQRLADDRTAAALSQRLSIPDIVGRVLAGRGVGVEECEDFLNPTLRSVLPDPSCLRDMDNAADRLADAIITGRLPSLG